MCLILVLSYFLQFACLKHTTIIQTSFLLIVRSSLLLLELELDELLDLFLCFLCLLLRLESPLKVAGLPSWFCCYVFVVSFEQKTCKTKNWHQPTQTTPCPAFCPQHRLRPFFSAWPVKLCRFCCGSVCAYLVLFSLHVLNQSNLILRGSTRMLGHCSKNCRRQQTNKLKL